MFLWESTQLVRSRCQYKGKITPSYPQSFSFDALSNNFLELSLRPSDADNLDGHSLHYSYWKKGFEETCVTKCNMDRAFLYEWNSLWHNYMLAEMAEYLQWQLNFNYLNFSFN
jgi:hypothetical protein